MLIDDYFKNFELKRSRYESEIEKINTLKNQTLHLKSKPFDKDYVKGGEREDFSDKVNAYVDLEQHTIKKIKEDYEKSLSELICLIYKLPDIKQCHLLHHVYINRRSMKEAAELMGVSYTYAYEIKRKALYKLNDMLTLNG